MAEPMHALLCFDNDERGFPHDVECECWCHELDLSEMNWCGFCLIPVPSGHEPPHNPNCPTLDQGETHG